MDRERCVAIAVARFARKSADRIEVAADGSVEIVRRFPRGRASKVLEVWFHFVRSPPHVGAATGPQSMLHVPEIGLPPPYRPRPAAPRGR